MNRGPLAGVLVVLGTTGPAKAASPLYVALDYEVHSASAGCLDERSFRTSVSDQLGYDPFRDDASRRVNATTRDAEHGTVGVVVWTGARGAQQGERRLESANRDCAEVTRAMAFAIAVQIQLLSSESGEAGNTSTPTEPQKPPTPETRRPDLQPSQPRADPHLGETPRDRKVEWLAGVGAGAAFGLAPTAAATGRVAIAARLGSVSGEIGGETSLPSTWQAPDGSGFELRFSLVSLGVCGHWHRVFGCALGKLGSVSVEGFGVDEPRRSSGVLSEVGARVGLSETFGKKLVGAFRIEGLAHPSPWAARLNGDDVWTAPAAALTVGADLFWSFP
jgi:hypothetical protein